MNMEQVQLATSLKIGMCLIILRRNKGTPQDGFLAAMTAYHSQIALISRLKIFQFRGALWCGKAG
jgi:hypothetical protein